MRISKRAAVFIALVGVVGVAGYLGVTSYANFQRAEFQKRLACRRLAMKRVVARRRNARHRRVRDHAAEIVQHLRALHRQYSNGDWTKLLELGDLYRKGVYPWFRGDRELALNVYRVACESPDPHVARAAQLRYIECRVDKLAKEDIHGAELPPVFAEEIQGVPDVPRTAPRHEEVIVSDSQNVHDHALMASLRKTLEHAAESPDAYEHVMDFVLNYQDNTVKEDAFRVLESLNDAEHSGLEISERAALNAVWAKISSLPGGDKRDAKRDAKDILVQQLASGVEQGAIVCSTGKIARIMGTMDGLSEGAQLKPMWAVREEIGSLAAKIRNAGGDDVQFREKALETYVQNLEMDRRVVENIVDEYALGF